MTTYQLTPRTNSDVLAEGTLLDCWKELNFLAGDLTVAEAAQFYKISAR